MSSIPFDYKNLLRVIQSRQSKGLGGEATFPTFSLTWLVANGGTASMTLTLAEGWYAVNGEDIVLASDVYHRDITALVFADRVQITPSPLTITRETEVGWGEYYVQTDGFEVRVTNNSGGPVYITLWMKAAFLQKSFYEELFRPLVDEMYEQLAAIARGRLKR